MMRPDRNFSRRFPFFGSSSPGPLDRHEPATLCEMEAKTMFMEQKESKRVPRPMPRSCSEEHTVLTSQ